MRTYVDRSALERAFTEAGVPVPTFTECVKDRYAEYGLPNDCPHCPILKKDRPKWKAVFKLGMFGKARAA